MLLLLYLLRDIERRKSLACESQLDALVNSLSAAHRATLLHIILHLRTVCSRAGSSHDNAVGRISEVFHEILLRPSWTNIMYAYDCFLFGLERVNVQISRRRLPS